MLKKLKYIGDYKEDFYNSIERLGIEKKIENSHYIDIILRVGGRDERYEFDFVKGILKGVKEELGKE